MARINYRAIAGLLGLGFLFLPIAHSQPVIIKPKAAPRLEAVAETKLLMEGLADANMRGLGKLLKEKPKEAEAWNFARGQALLIGETGNLLMMRPPKNANGEDLWMINAVEMRDSAATLARALAAKDYPKSRTGLAHLANVCNHCHQAFQVQVRVNPFGDD